MSTETTPDVGTIEYLDFDHAPPCEYSIHDQIGTGPAVWIVTLTPPLCGCSGGGRILMCDPCWKSRSGGRRETYCRRCGHVTPAIDSIVSAVRL